MQICKKIKYCYVFTLYSEKTCDVCKRQSEITSLEHCIVEESFLTQTWEHTECVEIRLVLRIKILKPFSWKMSEVN